MAKIIYFDIFNVHFRYIEEDKEIADMMAQKGKLINYKSCAVDNV